MSQSVELELVGQNVRLLRRRRGASIRSLAGRAQISTNTLLRVERGLATTERARKRVAEALDVTMDRLALPDCVQSVQATHPMAATQWIPYSDRRPLRAKELSGAYVNDPEERRRLGELKLVAAFVGVLRCALESGQMVGSLMEIYDGPDQSSRHPGEEFLHCLEGEILLRVGDSTLVLKSGDTTTFWADVEHSYEPVGKRAVALCVVREC